MYIHVHEASHTSYIHLECMNVCGYNFMYWATFMYDVHSMYDVCMYVHLRVYCTVHVPTIIVHSLLQKTTSTHSCMYVCHVCMYVFRQIYRSEHYFVESFNSVHVQQ